MSRALLDVNVLLALHDSDHLDHASVHRWLAGGGADAGWASCALTENGFVRIISQSRYPGRLSTSQAVRVLGASRDAQHEFWSCDLSLLDEVRVDATRLHGPRQVTDAYLLALAVRRGGRLVTFDRSISLDAVPGARKEHLLVL